MKQIQNNQWCNGILERMHKGWALLTAGSIDHYNAMTIGWGTFGSLWEKSVVCVYVRPSRYTHEFAQEEEYFTVSLFGEEHRGDLGILGKTSGRNGDKLAQTGLTPVAYGNAVCYPQAQQTIVCKKIYAQPFQVENLPEEIVKACYPSGGTHTMFVGEVVAVLEGEEA